MMPHHAHRHLHHARGNPVLDDIATGLDEIATAVAGAFGLQAKSPQDQETIISVVYVTASKTFSGEIGGYETAGSNDTPVTTPPASTTPPPKTATPTKAPASSVTQNSKSVVSTTTSETGIPSSILSPTGSLATTVPILAASVVPTSLSTISTTASPSATATSLPATNNAMSTGGKAGLAVGIILGVGAIVSLIFFCFRQRKKAQEQQQMDNEKSTPAGNVPDFTPTRAISNRSTKTLSSAPQLSLRPVTQFLPNLSSGPVQGSKLATAPENTSSAMAQNLSPASALERPMTPNGHNDQANPFGNHAEAANPFGSHAEAADSVNPTGPQSASGTTLGSELVAGAVAAGAVGAATGLARGASKRGPKAMDFTKHNPALPPPSPSGTELGQFPSTPTQERGAAVIAAAGGPQNSAVHRVQLDFIPSMEDELALMAGQLIRLLHEYDDGWALCIRLDRSAQGVVPRTCLSTRPVKPRPQQGSPRGPPPPGMRVPQQRPMSPAVGQNGLPMSSGPRNGPQGRPVSPAMSQGGRPQGSPAPRNSPPASLMVANNGSVRSIPSSAQIESRRLTPPGQTGMSPESTPLPPSPKSMLPVRKPVPGQAL